MENKIPFPGFVGPSYVTASDRFNNQRAVNLYLETDPVTSSAKNDQTKVLLGTPGFIQNTDFQNSFALRQLYVPSGNPDFMYAFVGNQVWVTSDGSSWQQCSGNLISIVGVVNVTDNGIDIVAVDGYAGYSIPVGGTVVSQISSPNFYPADTIDFQDGYFICNRKGTAQFFTSDLYAITWPALNTATKSSTPDPVVAVLCNNKLLYVFGTESIEIWSDTGASFTTPFAQIQGQYISIGCYSFASLAQMAGTIFWLGKTTNGSGIVYVLEGQSAKEVSTKPVSMALQAYENLNEAVGYGYQEEGHYFYCLNVPGADTTWVYDYTENEWHERQSFEVVPENFALPEGNSTGSLQPGSNTFDGYTSSIVMKSTEGNLVGIVFVSPIDSGVDVPGLMPADWYNINVSTPTKQMYVLFKYSTGEGLFPTSDTFISSDFTFTMFEIEGVAQIDLQDSAGADIILDWTSSDQPHVTTLNVNNTNPISATVLVVDTDLYSFANPEIIRQPIENSYLYVGLGNGSGDSFTITLDD